MKIGKGKRVEYKAERWEGNKKKKMAGNFRKWDEAGYSVTTLRVLKGILYSRNTSWRSMRVGNPLLPLFPFFLYQDIYIAKAEGAIGTCLDACRL